MCKFGFLALLLLNVTGCVFPAPVPHVTKRSPSLEGYVRDAQTGLPISGATVELVNRRAQDRHYASNADEARTGARTRTGEDGRFQLGPRYNFHYLGMWTPSFIFHVPDGNYWLGASTVRCEGYHSVSLRSQAELGDVQLIPKP